LSTAADTDRTLPRGCFWGLGALIGIIVLAIVIGLIFFRADRSPIVDTAQRPLVEAAREEFAVPSDFELSRFEAVPGEIPDPELDAVDPASVAVAVCPEAEEEACDAQSPEARLFFLHHLLQYGREDDADIYDFVFRRRDRRSPTAAEQELRLRIYSRAVAALVIRPTDWEHGLRYNQIAAVPGFLDSDLAGFLISNRIGEDVGEWAEAGGLTRTCIGYCPESKPSVRDRVATWLNTAVAYLETEAGRNLALALSGILGVVVAIVGAVFTFLSFRIKRSEFALLKEQLEPEAKAGEPGKPGKPR
jgi:hypothetical protein